MRGRFQLHAELGSRAPNSGHVTCRGAAGQGVAHSLAAKESIHKSDNSPQRQPSIPRTTQVARGYHGLRRFLGRDKRLQQLVSGAAKPLPLCEDGRTRQLCCRRCKTIPAAVQTLEGVRKELFERETQMKNAKEYRAILAETQRHVEGHCGCADERVAEAQQLIKYQKLDISRLEEEIASLRRDNDALSRQIAMLTAQQ